MDEKYTPYNPSQTEEEINSLWEKANAFAPKIDPKKKPFTIIMPPPNITGELHAGHAMFLTLEDIMTRYHRMKGDPTLWVPGLDHAAIAVQNVVEKKLAKEKGISRFQLREIYGREFFLKEVKAFIQEYRGKIEEQIKKAGASCDWSRLAYTMDKTPAVMEAFVRLYQEGLIYRGQNYLVNWCPRCGTTLSDLEVEHEEQKTKLWYVNYPLKGKPGEFIQVATTRPETIFGDVAVAVNPKDKRYRGLVGKTAILPIIEREVPIIADEAVDLKFGTGAVKITPAHDPRDFEIARKHSRLHSPISVLDEKGKFIALHPELTDLLNLKASEARVKTVEKIDKYIDWEKTKDYSHSVGVCYRCSSTVEPMLSTQWFVKTKPLAKKAIQVVKDGKIKFYPKRFEKTYFQWLENIHDWCVSRQIWWGQRIPVWYCGTKGLSALQVMTNNISEQPGCGEIIVQKEKPDHCPKCKNANLIQDPDTLDTWFSSGLWPISTLGWPDGKSRDLNYFYPTSVMETGYDILFFWVVRMVMLCTHFTGKVPFSSVYLHGLVRDKNNQKMSKSKGNVIDPVIFMEKYGTDALRMSLVVGQSAGNDLPLSEEKIKGYRNFVNKIWNASRFVMINLGDENIPSISEVKKFLNEDDRKMLAEIKTVARKTTRDIDSFKFGHAGENLYHSFWHIFCDSYLESVKGRLEQKGESRLAALAVLEHGLKTYLRLLHPFIPFVTEAIWQKLPQTENLLITELWPKA